MAVDNFSRDIAEKQPSKPREDLVRHILYFFIKCFMTVARQFYVMLNFISFILVRIFL
jgi:hypothetical protein